MCRFTLYLGPPIQLSSLVTEPKNSLIHQSYESRERREPLNGDGFGVAWYVPELDEEPALFRSVTPAWNNANLTNLARVVKSPCILAHVRAATQVRSVSEANCHPFRFGPLTFMHNGDVAGFPAMRRALLDQLSDATFQSVQGTTDSEHVFALFIDRLLENGTERSAAALAGALRQTIERVLELSARHGDGRDSYLNFAVSDGRCAVVTRYTTKAGYAGESLYLDRGRRFVCEKGLCRMVEPEEEGGAVLVSSEALSEDPGWEAVPRNHMLVIAEDRTVSLQAL